MIQMADLMLLSFCRRGLWGVRNLYGSPPHVRHEIGIAIVCARLEHAGLGSDSLLSKMLDCWNNSMNDSARG